MKILTVLGARPQFVKAAVVSKALREADLEETIIHTGQHYDVQMSDVFFDELGLPVPTHHLGIGGLSHGAMTGRMLEAIEGILQIQRPDWLLVYGDTNSTLAGALAASKLHIPVAHVEAGMRSFNRCMPEEVNRVLTDHISQLLFCTSQKPVDLLKKEGITQGVYNVGDVMYDAVLCFKQNAAQTKIQKKLNLQNKRYAVLTLHRQENTNDKERLVEIMKGIFAISQDIPIIFPIHPRTRKLFRDYDIQIADNHVNVIEPLSYFQMLGLLDGAQLVLTDSGGLQKEAMYTNTPCITLRDETEWVETVDSGWNIIIGKKLFEMEKAYRQILSHRPENPPHFYGKGNAAKLIVQKLGEIN